MQFQAFSHNFKLTDSTGGRRYTVSRLSVPSLHSVYICFDRMLKLIQAIEGLDGLKPIVYVCIFFYRLEAPKLFRARVKGSGSIVMIVSIPWRKVFL